jgi:tetrahydromethanopterin S-methyltransferase subunit G
MINPLTSFVSFLKDKSPNYKKLNQNLDDYNKKINEIIGETNNIINTALDKDMGNITPNGVKYLELIWTQLYNQHSLDNDGTYNHVLNGNNQLDREVW